MDARIPTAADPRAVPTLWPCSTCGADGVRDIGVRGYCAVHLEQLYATFDRSVFAFRGVGVQHGATRNDFGPHYVDLQCNACEATWVGVVGDACEWCARSYRVMIDHQVELVLAPPDVDLDDQRRSDMLAGWADRLWVAVEAGLIVRRQAEQVLQREVLRGAA